MDTLAVADAAVASAARIITITRETEGMASEIRIPNLVVREPGAAAIPAIIVTVTSIGVATPEMADMVVMPEPRAKQAALNSASQHLPIRPMATNMSM